MNPAKTEKKIPDVKPGDIVRVYQKIHEGGKEREQAFEGVVIKRKGGKTPGASFVIRKISQGIGVERGFLIHSPFLTRLKVKKRSKVKRADLSYLRNVSQIKRKLKDRKIEPFEESLVAGVKPDDAKAMSGEKEPEEIPKPTEKSIGEEKTTTTKSVNTKDKPEEGEKETADAKPAEEAAKTAKAEKSKV